MEHALEHALDIAACYLPDMDQMMADSRRSGWSIVDPVVFLHWPRIKSDPALMAEVLRRRVQVLKIRAEARVVAEKSVESLGGQRQSGVLAFDEYRDDIVERINLEAKAYHIGVDEPPATPFGPNA